MHIYFYSTKSCSEFIGFLVSCDGGAATLPHYVTKKGISVLSANSNFRQLLNKECNQPRSSTLLNSIRFLSRSNHHSFI